MIADWIGPSQVVRDVPVLEVPAQECRRRRLTTLNMSVWWGAERAFCFCETQKKLLCLRSQAERTVKSAQTLFHLHNPQVIISWDSVSFCDCLPLSPWTKAKGQRSHLSLTFGAKTFSQRKSVFMFRNLDINAAALFKVMKESLLNSLQRIFFYFFLPTCGLVSCTAKAANDVWGQCLQIEKLCSVTTRDVAQYSLLHAISRLSVPAPPFLTTAHTNWSLWDAVKSFSATVVAWNNVARSLVRNLHCSAGATLSITVMMQNASQHL